MSPTTAAAGLLLGAVLLHVGVARPARREAAAAQDEFARLREEKRVLQGRIAGQQRASALEAGIARMELPEDASGEASGDAVARLRRSLLESLRGQPVSGVRLAVSASRPPLAAKGRVEATGSFADVVRLSGRLVRPGAGLVLERVSVAPASGGRLTLEVEGASLLGGQR